MLPGHKVTRSVKWPICLLSRGTVLRKRHSSHRRKHNTAALTLVGQIWCLRQCGDIQKSTSMLEQYEHQGSLWKEVQQSKALTQLYAQTWNAELLAGFPHSQFNHNCTRPYMWLASELLLQLHAPTRLTRVCWRKQHQHHFGSAWWALDGQVAQVQKSESDMGRL